jgi:large subunit ribosomal protein L9
MVIKKFGPDKIGAIVKLKKGYVRNYLIPNGFCIRVQGNEKLIEREMENWQHKYQAQEAADSSILQKLKDLSISIKAASGFGGSLFGSITASNIVKELHDKNITLSKKNIVLNPIKFLGDYDVEINLNGERTTIKLQVIPAN